MKKLKKKIKGVCDGIVENAYVIVAAVGILILVAFIALLLGNVIDLSR